MVVWCCRVMTMVLALFAAPALAQATHIQPQLVAEMSEPAAGSTITIAVNMHTEKGWHGYWKNPGEAGFAPRFTWSLPTGVMIGDPAYPVPHALSIAGLVNYVFEADHALLFPLTVPKGLAAGTALPIHVSAQWLACTDEVCVPEKGAFALTLKVGAGAESERPQFDAWRAKLAPPLGGVVHFQRVDGRLRLAIPFPATADVGTPHFFPAETGMIVDAAPQRFSRSGDVMIADLALPKDGTAAPPPQGLLAQLAALTPGTVSLGDNNADQALSLIHI